MRWILWTPIIAACAHVGGPPASDPCRVLTEASAVAACVGKTVTLRGTVARSKIPTLLGVDIEAAGLEGTLAEATGLLESYVEEPRAPDEPIVASRGPGTYYALRDGAALAKARPVR